MTCKTLTICAAVGTDEHPIVLAAAQQLSEAVGAILGNRWHIALVLSDPDGGADRGSIWVASLIADIQRHEPIEATMQRWLERIERWSIRGGTRILVATLFRSVSVSSGDQTTIERLRRLNMMALHLSRQTGIEIIDIDRLFALCGARTLETDYRCQGKRAAEIGGHAIATAIFAGNLDDFLPAQIQENAARQHAAGKRWMA